MLGDEGSPSVRWEDSLEEDVRVRDERGLHCIQIKAYHSQPHLQGVLWGNQGHHLFFLSYHLPPHEVVHMKEAEMNTQKSIRYKEW